MQPRTDYRSQALSWAETADPHFPYETVHEGQRLVLRINDWPDEPSLYTLMIHGKAVLELEEWPTAWRRPRVRP